MKKIITLIVLAISWSQMSAQEMIATDFDLYKVKISFKDKHQKEVHGFLYSINDSVIVISDARKKSAYHVGDYSVTKYQLEQIKRIETHKLKGGLVGLLIGIGAGGAIGCIEGRSQYEDSGFGPPEEVLQGVSLAFIGAIVGAIVSRDVVSAKVGKTTHLVERFSDHAIVRGSEIVGHSRLKIFSIKPVQYRRNIKFVIGNKYQAIFEQPIYKGNSLLLGIGYIPMNSIDVVGDQIVNEYELKTHQMLIDVEHLKAVKDFTYGRISESIADISGGRRTESIYLSFDHFLPEYSIPITLDVRSYFGSKPDNQLKPFCEIGVGLSAIKGYDFTALTRDVYPGDHSFAPDFTLEEVVTLGASRFHWKTKLDLGLGFRHQKRKNLFWEIKRDFDLHSSKWERADISEDGIKIKGGFGHWTFAVGYNFGG